MVLHSPSNMESNQSRSSSRNIGGSREKYPLVHNDHIYIIFYQDFIVLTFISLLHVGMTQSARAKLPLSQVSHHLPCSHSSLLATLLRWRLFKAWASISSLFDNNIFVESSVEGKRLLVLTVLVAWHRDQGCQIQSCPFLRHPRKRRRRRRWKSQQKRWQIWPCQAGHILR